MGVQKEMIVELGLPLNEAHIILGCIFSVLFTGFDIVEVVLQGNTLAPYLFIICLDYVLRTSIDKIRENSFELTKKEKAPSKNNYRRRLRRCHSDTGKYTQPSRNITA